MSISDKIQKYAAAGFDRWHTPGHKGMLWGDDITELDGGDFFPAGELEKAQSYAAAAFKAKHVRFLTGGSSMGVKAAILACGGDIIAGSNSHQSVFEGAALAKSKVFVIENEVKDDLPLPLSKEQIVKAIESHPSAKAVLITSPDYFGRTAKEDIAAAIKERGLILIADSAHGAHFPFRDDLFPASFSQIADFCNMSAHKTLFSFTMGAYLCVNNESLLAKADEALKNLGTTSPLYPLLASLENAVTAAVLQKGLYDGLKSFVSDFKKEIKTLENDDFTRLVVDAQACDLSGKQLYDSLFSKGIAAETYTNRYVVFIATPADDKEKFERLIKGIKES